MSGPDHHHRFQALYDPRCSPRSDRAVLPSVPAVSFPSIEPAGVRVGHLGQAKLDQRTVDRTLGRDLQFIDAVPIHQAPSPGDPPALMLAHKPAENVLFLGGEPGRQRGAVATGQSWVEDSRKLSLAAARLGRLLRGSPSEIDSSPSASIEAAIDSGKTTVSGSGCSERGMGESARPHRAGHSAHSSRRSVHFSRFSRTITHGPGARIFFRQAAAHAMIS
jgi:hypothetical protein